MCSLPPLARPSLDMAPAPAPAAAAATKPALPPVPARAVRTPPKPMTPKPMTRIHGFGRSTCMETASLPPASRHHPEGKMTLTSRIASMWRVNAAVKKS
jgi:hypothetical protein